MGAWGFGIRDDDFVRDVIGVFEDHLKAGHSVADATKVVQSQFGGASEDEVDGPLFWIALADMQWTYGGLEASVLERVRDDFASGRTLRAWQDDPRALARRRAVVEKFIATISAENRRARKPPKTIVRAPRFRPGDCVSIRLSDGGYGAAIVLVAEHSIAEYGRNLVAVLDYHSATSPTMDVFRQRKFASRHAGAPGAAIAWYLPMGFRSVRDRLEVVGQVEILESDPKQSNFYFRWNSIGERPKDG